MKKTTKKKTTTKKARVLRNNTPWRKQFGELGVRATVMANGSMVAEIDTSLTLRRDFVADGLLPLIINYAAARGVKIALPGEHLPGCPNAPPTETPPTSTPPAESSGAPAVH